VERLRATYDILLIEDDEDTSEMLTECIESQSSYCVRSLSSGEAVLQQIQEIKEVAPSLFIIDFLLPGMTGLQLFDHLRSLEAFGSVPAIMLTAATLSEDIQNALRDRNLSWFPKPFELDNLLDYLECVLTNSTQQLL
jgi:DNA-binding response OmpR family regulator